MTGREYVPDVGDIVWIEFSPQVGREPELRPAIVLSDASYNGKSGLAVCCPITSQIKGYPFEVAIEIEGRKSAILADQAKSLDWRARKVRRWGRASGPKLGELRAKVKVLLAI